MGCTHKPDPRSRDVVQGIARLQEDKGGQDSESHVFTSDIRRKYIRESADQRCSSAQGRAMQVFCPGAWHTNFIKMRQSKILINFVISTT